MQVMVQHNSSIDAFDNLIEIHESDSSVSAYYSDGSQEELKGELINISSASVIGIRNYYGEEISKISGKDIHGINENVVSLYVSKAIEYSDRVQLEFKKKDNVEINGKIIGGMSDRNLNTSGSKQAV